MCRMAYYYARHSGRYAYETISRRCQFADRQRLKSVINCVVSAVKNYFLFTQVLCDVSFCNPVCLTSSTTYKCIYVYERMLADVYSMYLQWLVINTSCVTTSPYVSYIYILLIFHCFSLYAPFAKELGNTVLSFSLKVLRRFSQTRSTT